MLPSFPVNVRNEIEKRLSPQARLSLALASKSHVSEYEELNRINLFWKESLERLLSLESGCDVTLDYTGVDWRNRYRRYLKASSVDEFSDNIYATVYSFFSTDILDAEIIIQSGFFLDSDVLVDSSKISYALDMAITNCKLDIIKLLFNTFDKVVYTLMSSMNIGSIVYGSNEEELQPCRLELVRLLYPLVDNTNYVSFYLQTLVKRENVELVKELYFLVKDLPGVDAESCEHIAVILNNDELIKFFKDQTEEYIRIEWLSMAVNGIDLRNIVRPGDFDGEICHAYISNGHFDLYKAFLEYANLTDDMNMFNTGSSSDYLAIALNRGFDIEPIEDILINNIGSVLRSALVLCLTEAIRYIVNNYREMAIERFVTISERIGVLPLDVEQIISPLRT
jgi:hypothetical protein